jgi:hypothetical protein
MLLVQGITKTTNGLLGVENIPRIDTGRSLAGLQHEE